MTLDTADRNEAIPPPLTRTTRYAEVALSFLRLGCFSFGGPLAHLGYLRSEFVEKRRWIDDAQYSDLVALCQFLPGPSSSQLVFSLGQHRAGIGGALVASLCFLLPSALLMLAFAYGVAGASDPGNSGWLHGLKLAAVAVVAQAVWGMGKNLCTDRTRVSLCLGAAGALLLAPGALAQLAVIAGGAAIGFLAYRRKTESRALLSEKSPNPTAFFALATLALFASLFVVLPAVAKATHSRAFEVFDSFYRSGSLVFGGGHVVLPLLRSELVPRGFLEDAQFLAGYGAAQALPGPLFAFAAYIGALAFGNSAHWQGGVLCLFAIMLPAWLLIASALPFWHRLRRESWAQAAIMGANASVVGVLLAALYDPVISESIRDERDVVASLAAFGLLEQWKVPPWLVVVALAVYGRLACG